ncbi:MAG: gliding motility-associated ABC transporter substrate-binding protein GldG [Bacteroidales bacterium]|jgi:ABC-2 type transport system permease protein|nr:gliding motility-associated ABC transporter substrate-binding protein GldG [Bacteroidales bacterium]
MNKKITKKDKNISILKSKSFVQLFVILAIIIGINIVSIFIYHRFDLTAEKRYTLSTSTKTMLSNLKDVIYVRIYLSGKALPPNFVELSQKTREFLDEMRAYSDNIEYEFIDPSEGHSSQEMDAIYGELYKKGLRPQAIQTQEADGVNTRYIVPGALMTYQQKEIPISLVDSDDGALADENEIIKYSIEKLEYNLGNAVRRITNQQLAKVAFIKGHGELSNMQILRAGTAIAQFYSVDSILLNHKLTNLFEIELTDSVSGDYTIKSNKYDLLIVAKPTEPFDNYDKFLLDQFIMRGGRVLWYIDPVLAEMDTLNFYPEMPFIGRNLNIEDMFFQYGVRLNTNLLLDLNALPIPVETGRMAGQPQYTFIPWYYFPIITPLSEHPIVKNLNPLRTEFVSSIDTVGRQGGLTKTILLTTSTTTKMVNAPAVVSLQTLKKRANLLEFNRKHLPVSVLVEGVFHSVFSSIEGKDVAKLEFIPQSKPTKMIFVADGDMIKNQIAADGYVYPLGVDRFTGQFFGNKNFLLNAVNYLCDDENILQVRSKDFKMRLLDSKKIIKEKAQWQVLNMILPLALVIILALILFFIRYLKYVRK